jgi:hypothetical protein
MMIFYGEGLLCDGVLVEGSVDLEIVRAVWCGY